MKMYIGKHGKKLENSNDNVQGQQGIKLRTAMIMYKPNTGLN